MKILKESKDFEVAVGQTRQWDSSGKFFEIKFIDGEEVIGKCRHLERFDVQELKNYSTLTRHQSGAEIDFEKYAYCEEDPGENINTWRIFTCQGWCIPAIGGKALYRRPKAEEKSTPAVSDAGYVDCEVWVNDYGSLYFKDPSTRFVSTLLSAINRSCFIGYIYGDEVSMSPRRHGGKDRQAQYPTHVRFKREVVK